MDSAAEAASKPNIIFILADDMGYSDLGCYGGEIATPQLDKLAGNGLRFTQFYNTGRCWPSRASLLTGYYAQQVNRDPSRLRPHWAMLLPQMLKPVGYHNYHSGKWHIDGPVLEGGFEHSYLLVDPDRNFGPKNHQLDDKPLPQPKPEDHFYTTTAVSTHAVEWLNFHDSHYRGEPFFLYVAFTVPHFPIQAPAEDIARYKDRYSAGWDVLRDERWKKMKKLGIINCALSALEPDVIPAWNKPEAELKKAIGEKEVAHAFPWNELTTDQKEFQAEKMAVHAAMVDRMDREIGHILEKVRAMGAAENTIVMFASDNGASAEQIIRGDGHDPTAPTGSAGSFLGIGPGWSSASNTPLRRHKSWVHEGGISTPLIVNWPAGIKAHGELRHAPSHLVDIVPTLLELTGAKSPEKWANEDRPPLAGKSLVPAFEKDAAIPRDFIYFSHIGNRALRVGDWKIAAAGADGPWELYNLAKDRCEMNNLAAEMPDKVKELAAIWTRQDEEYKKQAATAPKGAPGKKGKGKASAD
jgi:arylsulfatase